MPIRTCDICGDAIEAAPNTAKRRRIHCARAGYSRGPSCWETRGTRLHAAAFETMRNPSCLKAGNRDILFAATRDLVAACGSGAQALEDYLRHADRVGLGMLLRSGSMDMQLLLHEALVHLPDVVPIAPPRASPIPHHLPEGLRDALAEYRQTIETRYRMLTKKGHTRSGEYVYERMRIPIRLAQFLYQRGVSRWDVMQDNDVNEFLAANPRVKSYKLLHFFRFVTGKMMRPDRRGHRYKTTSARFARREPPKALQPNALKAFLASARDRLPPAEYAFVWLVGAAGLRATAAYDLSLDRITLADDGRVLIRPHSAWVPTPAHVGNVLANFARKAPAAWPADDPDSVPALRFLRPHLPALNQLYGRCFAPYGANTIRNSGLLRAMYRGHNDRVVVHFVTGASMGGLAQLEHLLPVDMHHRVDPALVQARNKKILARDE